MMHKGIWALCLSAAALSASTGCESATTPVEPEVETLAASSASVRWVPVEAKTEGAYLEAPAVVRASADAQAEVAASARAQVRQVHVTTGSPVERGAPVVDVSAPDWIDAAAEYMGVSAQLDVHEARAKELLSLRERGLVGRAEVFTEQALVTDLGARKARAAATLRSAGLSPTYSQALVQRGFATLRAPVAGVVVELNAHPGQIREPGDPPFARVQGKTDGHVEVRTMQPWPEAAASFQSGETGALELSPTPLSEVVDPHDGTRITWLAFADESTRLTDGLRGVARVAAPGGTWSVPATALASVNGRSLLRRKRGDSESDVAVRVLMSDGARAWVAPEDAAQLAAGDSVAADIRLVDALDSEPQGSESEAAP